MQAKPLIKICGGGRRGRENPPQAVSSVLASFATVSGWGEQGIRLQQWAEGPFASLRFKSGAAGGGEGLREEPGAAPRLESWCSWEKVSDAARGPSRALGCVSPLRQPCSKSRVSLSPFVLSSGRGGGRVVPRSAPHSSVPSSVCDPRFCLVPLSFCYFPPPSGTSVRPAHPAFVTVCVWPAALRPLLTRFCLFAGTACHKAGLWQASHILRIWPWVAPPLGGQGSSLSVLGLLRSGLLGGTPQAWGGTLLGCLEAEPSSLLPHVGGWGGGGGSEMSWGWPQ